VDDQEPLRPEVVAALSQPAHLPAELVDQVLDASDAERAAAFPLLVEEDRRIRERAGFPPLPRSIMDVKLVHLEQAAAIYGLVYGYARQPGLHGGTLGDLLKVVDRDTAETVHKFLVWFDLLPPEDEA
jgi:hypothetical protein